MTERGRVCWGCGRRAPVVTAAELCPFCAGFRDGLLASPLVAAVVLMLFLLGVFSR